MAARVEKLRPLANARGSVSVLCAFACLVCGCGRHDPARAERSVRQIKADLGGGQLDQALSLARSNAELWADRRGSDAYVQFKLLEADVLLSKRQASQANPILSNLQVPPSNRESEIRRQTLLGRSWTALRKYELAGIALHTACELAAAQGLKKPLLDAQMAQGTLLSRQRKFDESEVTLRSALSLADELNDQSQRMVAFLDLGFNRVTQFHYDGAIPYFEKALIAGQSAADKQPLSVALVNLAICQYRLGDFETASRNVRQAISIQEAMGSEGSLVYSYGELANIYLLQREYPRAIASYEQALGLAVKLGSDREMEMTAANLASAYIGLQDWEKAGKLNQQARAIADRMKDLEHRPDLLLSSAAIEAGRAHPSEAVRLYSELLATAGATENNTWEAHAGLAHLYAQAGETKQAAEHFEQAVQAIERARSGLSRDKYKLTFLDPLIRFHQDYVDFLIDQGNDGKALDVADSSRALVLADGLSGGRRLDFQSVAKASHTILISYWITPGRSVAWVITPIETRMETLTESGAKIQNLVEQYGAEVAHGIGDPARSGSAAGRKLYQVLVQPFRQFIPAGAKVIVVPDGPLHNLNFETLPMPGDAPRYWIEDVTLSVAPSLALLARKDVDRTRRRGILLIGDPEPTQQYPRLRFAQREMNAIRQHYPGMGTKVLSASDATPSVYRSMHPEQFALIHFTAHAEANSESPLDSAVILSRKDDEYKLYGRDVFGTGLQAELVTVSACRSAGAKAYSGEGLIGFAWAFLHAGAKNVIAGLWDVDDGSTPRLMDRMYAELASGSPPDRALREAKLALIHSTGNYRKPYYWGALQVYRRTAE